MYGPGPAAAHVTIVTLDNETYQDAYQFDPPFSCGCAGATGATGGTGPSWNLLPNLRMDIKRKRSDPNPLLTLTSAAGQLSIVDAVNRIVEAAVPEGILTAVLIPGTYVYDLVNYDNSVPPIRMVLMGGEFVLKHGVSGG
jgi:hypothetical protein